jgi:hypothetical protein
VDRQVAHLAQLKVQHEITVKSRSRGKAVPVTMHKEINVT